MHEAVPAQVVQVSAHHCTKHLNKMTATLAEGCVQALSQSSSWVEQPRAVQLKASFLYCIIGPVQRP